MRALIVALALLALLLTSCATPEPPATSGPGQWRTDGPPIRVYCSAKHVCSYPTVTA